MRRLVVFSNSPIVDGQEIDVNLTAKKYSPDIRVFSDDDNAFVEDNSLANAKSTFPSS